MKRNWKRIFSFLLVTAMLAGMMAGLAQAADSEEEAMSEIPIYNGGQSLACLAVNGRVQDFNYVYYLRRSGDGSTKEIPTYCVNPTDPGVPQKVPVGSDIKYIIKERESDPKVMGIVANGYPTKGLGELGLNDKVEGYYATKIALWCYIIPGWNISNVTVNPAADQAQAQRVLTAAKKIYDYGTAWTEVLNPGLTVSPVQPEATLTTIDGQQYKEQTFTVHSETFVGDYAVNVSFKEPDSVPAGARIVNMDNQDITTITMEGSGSDINGQFKVLYPLESVEGQSGSDQIWLSANTYQYGVFYASCAETDTYGTVQNYMCDTDPTKSVDASVISKYSDGDGSTIPDEPGEPDSGKTALKIVKLEEGTKTPLEGAIFDVEGPDGNTIGSFSTGPDGTVIIPVERIGSYVVTEITPPKHHLLAKTPTQTVSVSYGRVATVTFENAPYGNLRVEKVSDTGDHLTGVTVQVKHIESGTTYNAQTGPGGAAVFEKLKPGAYEVSELAGIEGWKADTDTVKTVSVVKGETAVTTLTNKELPGLRILKYDRQTMTVMKNVTFEIYKDGELFGTKATNEMGEILLTNLQPGTYRVVEAHTGDDAHLVDPDDQEVELHAGDGIKELTFFNSKKPGIHLVKVDSVTMKSLPNVRFQFKKVGGSYQQEFTTDIHGEIDLSKLEPGAYEVTELEAPDGYLIDDAVRVIQLNPDENAEFVFTNTPKPKLRLIKTSSDGTRLGGVHFRIAKIEDGSHYLDRITDVNGEISIDKLEPGVYSVKETATTSNHILDVREYHVELFPGQTSTLTIENQRRPGLTIRKTDKDTGEPIRGVTFTIRFADGHTITTMPTGADGTVRIDNLLPGVYTVTEQNVPQGYILDTAPQQITLFPNRDASVQFQNYKRPTLKIAKVDINGKPLTGAIFEVKTKAGVKIGDFPVGADGTITVSNVQLTEGYYIVTEKQAPEGYILDKTPHEVYLRPGKTTEISIENEKKPGLTIYKVDSITGGPVKGAKFEIYVSKDKTEHGTYQKLDSTFYFSDENGIIHLDELDTGWYKVVEVEPAAGFTIKEPAEQILYVEHDKAAEITFENTPLNGIVVEKYDNVTHAALPGCTFQLRYLSGTSGTGGTVIGQKVTGKNGTVMWTGLKPGAYVVEEVDPAEGYSILNSSETVYIADNGEQSVITVRFSNSPDGNLLIRKVCSVNPSVTLQNAEFKITYADGTVIGDSNGVFRTDENGEIRIDGLKPGKSVIVTETKAPAGFLIDTQSQTVQIKEGRTVSLTFKNQPKGKLIIQKRDSQTNQPLPGAQFRVTTAAGCEVGLDGVIGTASLTQNGIFTTNSQGEITITNLAPGAYVLNEIKAPSGYVMDAPSTNVVIGANGDTQTIIITNTPKASLTIFKRDSVTRKPLAGAEFDVRDSEGRAVGPNNGRYTTGTNGTVTVSGLEPGAAIMASEVKAPKGYILDETPKSIVVKSGVVNSLIFDNEPGTTLVIHKYIDGTENEPLSGVGFKVVDGSGAAVGPDDGTYYTDKAGEIVLNGLVPGTTVTAREIKTVDGFVLDGTPQDILIKAGEVQNLTFWNKRAGTLVIEKLDSITKAPLAGAQFKVLYADGRVVDTEGGKLSSKGIYTTDEKGQIKITQITGTLVVTEEKAPDGYVMDVNGKSQTVTVNPNDTQTLQFFNEPLCNLTITKVDSVRNKPVPNTEFTVKDGNGTIIGKYVTGKDGTVTVTGLIPNKTYVVTETKVPSGYVLNAMPQFITVKNGSNTLTGGAGIVTGTADSKAPANSTANVGTTGTTAAGGNGLTFENDPKVTLTIKKYITGTKNEPLSGVAFKVTDGAGAPLGGGDGVFYTDAAGQIAVGNLEPGMIVNAQEVSTVEGYVLDGTPKSVKIVSGEKSPELVFWNAKAGNLIIRKLDKRSGKPLAGVEFELTYADGGYVDNANGHLSSKGLYTTDAQGEIRVTGITGTIVVKETRTLPGYTIDPGAQSQTVVVKPADTQTLTFYNTPGTTLTIQKYIDGTTDPLAGVTFLVTDSGGTVLGADNGEFVTDRNGRIVLENLLPGETITAKEVRTVAGFVLDGAPQSIKIKEGDGQQLTFTNKRAGTLVIEKLDSVSNTPLAGAQFKVQYADGRVVDTGDGKLSSSGVYTTDRNGQIQINGITGTFVITEEKAPDGYVLDNNNRKQTVVVSPGETKTAQFFNDPLCSLTLTKLDSVSGKPVPNTQFTVKDGNGNVIGQYATGKDGTVTVTGLIPGAAYVVSETKVPSGYVLNTTPQTIVVKNGANTLSGGAVGTTGTTANSGNGLTFENDPKMTLTIQKYVKGTDNEPLAGVTFKVTDGSGAPVGGSDGIFRTDKTGSIVVENLEPGTTVIAREVETVEGYVLDGEPKSVKIQAGEKAPALVFWNQKAGELVIRKLDKLTKKPLAGVEFELTYADGGYVDNANGHLSSKGLYITDENGEIRVTGVTGTIVAKETKTLPGYTIDPATQSQTVVVNPADTQTLTFYNTPGTTLTIQKYIDGTTDPLAGVAFLVTDSSGAVLGTNGGEFVTDENGRIVIENLIPGETITAKEVRTVEGYVLDTAPKSIRIREGEGQQLTFTNKRAGTLVIEKLDSATNAPLAGAQFQLTYTNGAYLDIDNGHLSGDGIYTTNELGEIRISGLTGTVIAKEVKAAPGYVIDNSSRSQTVTVKPNETKKVIFHNEPLCSLTLTKLDSVSGKPVPGTQFAVKDGSGNVIGQYTTGKDGTVTVTGLIPGAAYVVSETKVPSGYVLNSTPQTIVVKNGANTLSGGAVGTTGTMGAAGTTANGGSGLTFENDPKMTLTIRKYIEGTDNEPLPGVSFKVTDGSGAPVGSGDGVFRTDKTGSIVIEGLEPGTTVTAQEVKTVEGYVLDGTPKSVKIKAGEKAPELVFWNQKAGGLVIRKLDKLTGKPLAGVEFELTYADGGFVDNANGHLSSKGLYTTDAKGEIRISGITGTIVVKETKTLPGYTIDPGTQSQTVTVNPADTQTVTFYNTPGTTLTIQKYIDGTTTPIQGVSFLVTDSSGAVLGPNGGEYVTDKNGRIVINDLVPGVTITAKETKTADGYVIDSTPQSILIKEGEAQTLTFYNKSEGGLELIKVSASDKSKRIPNVTFEIRKKDGGLVETVTTGKNGSVHVDLDAGDYYAVEIEAAKGFEIDETPQYFTVVDGKTTTLTVTNKALSGILIHKINSVTGKGIQGVTFLLYDSTNTPIGQYTSDDSGYVYIENLTTTGRFYLRELENEGYVPDNQMKTVYVTAGETTLVEWKNIPITAQIQIIKRSADYNPTNGLPAGTLLEGAVFEIYDKANNLVDTIKSDQRGLAASNPLPLGRYTIREIKAPANYGVSDTVLNAYLEHEGQIVTFEVTNKALSTGVNITKTGPKEAMAGQPVRYQFSGIANRSNVRLDSFYWRDTLPAEVRLNTVVTGTYNFPGTYKITYRVNGGEPRTLADSLSTSQNYTLAASNVALGLASNERVTEIMFVFGQAPAGFAQVETPYLHCTAVSNIKAASFVNVADVGGAYNGVWVQGVSRWVTTVYGKPSPLPKTGY